MSRKPAGNAAMSGAERQRRYMERLRRIGNADLRKPAAASYTQPSGRGAREAYLRDRVRELEARITGLQTRIAELTP
jgi:hypothetical protein